MNQTLLNLLQNKSTLKIAADWVNDNPNDPFVQNNPILHYTLLWLIKHNKYPMIIDQIVRNKPLLTEDNQREIIKQVAQDHDTCAANLTEKLAQARKEFRKTNNLKITKTTVPKLYFKAYDTDAHTNKEQHELPLPRCSEIFADTWEEMLLYMIKRLEYYHRIFQI